MNEFINILPTLLLTLKLGFLTTILLLLLVFPISYILVFSNINKEIKILLEIILTLPLILPPTVLGFYLLILLNQNGLIGKIIYFLTNKTILFRFEGILLASIIFSFPFMLQPILSSIKTFPKILLETSYILGKSKLYTFINVIIPNIKTSIISGIILSFAHTLGEFGIILMVGGSIENETKVMSIAIYEEVQLLNYKLANFYSLILLITSILLLYIFYKINIKKNELF
ncbi:MAG: hypothetical protein KatS3mg129_0961 [Leptospiraceae bacterium]|nr:MAG: hypothetical protein KatS3mg129_0961 [Leptospiraceae bacterium]